MPSPAIRFSFIQFEKLFPLMNGCPYKLIVLEIVLDLLFGVACYMGRAWKLSFHLDMPPWIVVTYSVPLLFFLSAGEGSFSNRL